jgi:putative membrane protein
VSSVSRVIDDPDDDGEEPDARFTLANERTFLAWNRTALALIGGGLAAGQLLDVDGRVARLLVALPPIALGAVLAVASYGRWEANQRALRRGEPLPSGGPSRILAAGIALVAVVVAAILVRDVLT